MTQRIAHDIAACPCPWHPKETRLIPSEQRLFDALHPLGQPRRVEDLPFTAATLRKHVCQIRPKIRPLGYRIELIRNAGYCMYKVQPPEATNGEAQP